MTEFHRREVERRTGAGIVYLGSLPRWLPFLGVIVLLGVAFFAGDALGGLVGLVTLGTVALLLAWLGYTSWPRIGVAARAVRVVALVAVVGGALSFVA